MKIKRYKPLNFNESEFKTYPTDITEKDLKDLASGKFTWIAGQWIWDKNKKALYMDMDEVKVYIKFYHTTSYKVTNKLRDPNLTSHNIYIEIIIKNGTEETKRISFKGFRGEDLNQINKLDEKLIQWAHNVLHFKLGTEHIEYI
jgi:hypothetical protein